MLQSVPSNIEQCIIITIDSKENHLRKKYVLEYNNVIEKEIRENITYEYSKNIIKKLKEKSWLSKLQTICTNEADYDKYARDINDIIDFLYIVTAGKGFEEHFYDLISISSDDMNAKYLLAVSTLSMMGIAYLPIRVLSVLFINQGKEFDLKAFREKYKDWVEITNGCIHLRCLRLIQKSIANKLGYEDVEKIIEQVVRQSVGQFDERTTNEWSSLFQKVLLFKTIKSQNILPVENAKKLFARLENICKN